MKLYASGRGIAVPPAWLRGMGAPQHVLQAYVVAVARSKPAAGLMLSDAGAWRLIDELHTVRDEPPVPVQALLDARVISADFPGIWAWTDTIDGPGGHPAGAIISVHGGACKIVARWRYDDAARAIKAERSSDVLQRRFRPVTSVQAEGSYLMGPNGP